MIDWSAVIASAIGEYVAGLALMATFAILSKNIVRDLVVLAVETCVKATKRDYKDRFKKYQRNGKGNTE
jgi:hypothetical protein